MYFEKPFNWAEIFFSCHIHFKWHLALQKYKITATQKKRSTTKPIFSSFLHSPLEDLHVSFSKPLAGSDGSLPDEFEK